MARETTNETLDRISRTIAQLGSGELIPISRVVVERGVRVLKRELYRRVDDPDESLSHRSDEEQDDHADGTPHNID